MTTIHTLAIPQHCFNALEVHPCKEYEKGTPEAFVEQIDPKEETPDFWSVYVRYNPKTNEDKFGGLECIADCDSEDEANRLVAFLKTFAKLADLEDEYHI
jgi:hypothetical protein